VDFNVKKKHLIKVLLEKNSEGKRLNQLKALELNYKGDTEQDRMW
jgi:hypothetical protein